MRGASWLFGWLVSMENEGCSLSPEVGLPACPSECWFCLGGKLIGAQERSAKPSLVWAAQQVCGSKLMMLLVGPDGERPGRPVVMVSYE